MKLFPVGANQTEVLMADGSVLFFSYRTCVAARLKGERCCRTEKYHSVTTSKHINKFMVRNGDQGHYTVKPQSWFDSLGAGC